VISFFLRTRRSAFVLALACLPLAAAVAQNTPDQGPKPVAIVSVAPIREHLNDLTYVTRIAGMEDQGELLRLILSTSISGLDKDRPIGLYFMPGDEELSGVLFVPVAPGGMRTILKMHRDRFGEPKDVGGGIQQVGVSESTYIKEVTGPNQLSWVFAAANKELLANLPADPVRLLGDLPNTYNVAGKIMVPNIPEKLRRTVVDELKFAIERYFESSAGRRTAIDREQAIADASAQVGIVEKLLNESDELLIGIAIDEAAKRIIQDVRFSAKEGTALARTVAMQSDLKTNFPGFMLPEAALSLSIAGKASPEDIAQATATLQAIRGHLAKHVDDSPDIPGDKREAIKSLLAPLFDVLSKTVATGRIDGGLSVVLLPKSLSFVAGGSCADGPAVESILKSLAEIGRDIPNFPKLQFNTASIGDMKLHRLTAPISPSSPARDVLGDTLELVIAIAPQSVVVAGGPDAEGLLRKVLDHPAQEREQAVLPLQVNIAVLPIVKYFKSFDDNPNVNKLIVALEQSGNDRITATNRTDTRSSTTRIEIQEGAIKAIGAAAKRVIALFFRP